MRQQVSLERIMEKVQRQVQRYIRLTELISERGFANLDLVDKKKLQFTVAIDISYIDKEDTRMDVQG